MHLGDQRKNQKTLQFWVNLPFLFSDQEALQKISTLATLNIFMSTGVIVR